jgi:hypothetical protein
MIKSKIVHQINIKIEEKDLAFLDAKAKRYGMSRSAMLKYFGLNAEFNTSMQEQLRRPVI